MGASEKLLWKLYAGAVGAATTIVAQKLVTLAWEAATGDEPPDPNDPETPLVSAVSWALASGVGVGMAQLIMNRFVQSRWLANMGHQGPSKLSNKLDL